MEEISVSSQEEFNITHTADGRIRIAHGLKAYLLHPYDASLLSVRTSHLARNMLLDRLPENQEPIVRSPVYGPPSY